MLISIFIFFINAESDEQFTKVEKGIDNSLKVICPKNSKLKNGICTCKKGFMSNDTSVDMNLGCWKCEPQCSKNAICTYPGNCYCDHSKYDGNGIQSCSPKFIDITNVSPLSCEIKKQVPVQIELKDEIPNEYPKAFIKFDSEVTIANISIGRRNLVCLSPISSFSHSVKLSVSFDKARWTKYEVDFKYELPSNNYETLKFTSYLFLIGSCVLTIAYSFYYMYNYRYFRQ